LKYGKVGQRSVGETKGGTGSLHKTVSSEEECQG
jgi:hypothetical protein